MTSLSLISAEQFDAIASKNDTSSLKKMLDTNNINTQIIESDIDGEPCHFTPLNYSIFKFFNDIIPTLVEIGANINNATDKIRYSRDANYGNITPLAIAILSANHIATEYLLNEKAFITQEVIRDLFFINKRTFKPFLLSELKCTNEEADKLEKTLIPSIEMPSLTAPLTHSLLKKFLHLKPFEQKTNKANALLVFPQPDRAYNFFWQLSYIQNLMTDYNIKIAHPDNLEKLNKYLKKRSYSLLVFYGHGSKRRLKLSDSFALSNKHAFPDFTRLDKNAIIVLNACYTGFPDGIGQTISNLSNRKVIAPTEMTNSDPSQIISEDKKLKVNFKNIESKNDCTVTLEPKIMTQEKTLEREKTEIATAGKRKTR